MKEFKNVEQRIINTYMDLFPPYKPCNNSDTNESSQKQFYDFMQSMFIKLYENPLLLFSKTNPDDFFVRRFNKHSENKQSSYNMMKKIVKTMEEFSVFLYGLGKTAVLNDGAFVVDKSFKIPKRYISILEQCEINCQVNNTQTIFQSKKYPELFYCWKWLSESTEHSLPHFISCMFDKNYPYTAEIYSKLADDIEAYKKLESFLLKNNYKRIDNRDNKVNLDYVKNYDKKENKLKEAWGERTHGGISAQYDSLMKNPPLYSLRVPFYKTLLEQSEKMPDTVKELVVKKGKKCDNCRYCVQMDKTGKRPLAFVTVTHQSSYNMCSYFPGFYYCWESLDNTIADNIIEFLIFADNTLKEKLN